MRAMGVDAQMVDDKLAVKASENIATRTQSIRSFLDAICQSIGLNWEFDLSSNTVKLNLLWKTADERSPEELLQFLREPGYSTDYKEDPKWQAAFNALLSNPVNFEKSWRVRQQALLEQLFLKDRVTPVLVKPFVSKSLQKYILVLIEQQIRTYPGHGSISYYWFKDDGSLEGAGLFNTGHRCALIDATVDFSSTSQGEPSSELQLILKFNLVRFYIARFELDTHGLRLISLTDANGQLANNNGLNIGEPLLK